jgi:hypothetical protein
MATHDLLHPLGDGTGTPSSGVISTVKPPNPSTQEDHKPKIQHINQALMGNVNTRHTDNWKRKTNLTGTGATHVRSFHCRLAPESLAAMDDQINQWLDAHPDYEVKFVATNVGDWQGKVREPALIVSLWV